MTFKGIIFDFNGVLWWDTHLHGETWNRYAANLRGAPLSPEELAEHVIGRDNRSILHYITGELYQGQELEDQIDRKETIYRNLCLEQGDEFRLSPGAIELLDWLQAHQIGRAIATSAGEENVLFYYIYLGLWRWFDLHNIVYDDNRINPKPAPEPYLQAAERLGISPARCAVVEDSHYGIQSARSAGIGCIIALGDEESRANLGAIDGVKYVIENLGELPAESLFAE